MKARSNSKQAILTLMALLIPVAIFIAAAPTNDSPIKPPAKDPIPVAFLISDGAVVIDFCGPWEVFQDAYVPSRPDSPFRLYTVSETKKPIRKAAIAPFVMEPTFNTDRLRVWELYLKPHADNHPRAVYLACWNNQDRPCEIATATLWPETPLLGGAYLEWIEVVDRRQGVAVELLLAIEKRLGKALIVDGTTPEGDALEAAWRRARTLIPQPDEEPA